MLHQHLAPIGAVKAQPAQISRRYQTLPAVCLVGVGLFVPKPSTEAGLPGLRHA